MVGSVVISIQSPNFQSKVVYDNFRDLNQRSSVVIVVTKKINISVIWILMKLMLQ